MLQSKNPALTNAICAYLNNLMNEYYFTKQQINEVLQYILKEEKMRQLN